MSVLMEMRQNRTNRSPEIYDRWGAEGYMHAKGTSKIIKTPSPQETLKFKVTICSTCLKEFLASAMGGEKLSPLNSNSIYSIVLVNWRMPWREWNPWAGTYWVKRSVVLISASLISTTRLPKRKKQKQVIRRADSKHDTHAKPSAWLFRSHGLRIRQAANETRFHQINVTQSKWKCLPTHATHVVTQNEPSPNNGSEKRTLRISQASNKPSKRSREI